MSIPPGYLPSGNAAGILLSMDKYERRRQRLIELRDTECHGSAAALARKIEREPSYVTRMLYPEGKDGKKRIADDMMEVIENAFALPRGWLDSTKERHAEHHVIDAESDYAAVRRVRFKISAGISGYSIEYLNGHRAPIFFRKDWLNQRGYNPDKLVAVTVSGASMEPSLFDGDLVVINLDDAKLVDGVPYAANYEGEVVVKRLKRDAGEWWLSSDNQDKRRFPDKRCTDQVFIIGRIVHKQSEHI